jgi:hypothetical protein
MSERVSRQAIQLLSLFRGQNAVHFKQMLQCYFLQFPHCRMYFINRLLHAGRVVAIFVDGSRQLFVGLMDIRF